MWWTYSAHRTTPAADPSDTGTNALAASPTRGADYLSGDRDRAHGECPNASRRDASVKLLALTLPPGSHRAGGRAHRYLRDLCDQGVPYPPPPGVSMTSVSPGWTSVESHPASSTVLPSARSTRLRPSAPGEPPAIP